MDPTNFTKTSFCNVEIDNITTNESKEYILNQMSILCSDIKYNSRYAKVYNDQYSNNLKNPHIICLKSSGTPYLLFLTQINNTNYCFLIDKKIKEGYSYPKIFIIPYHFKNDLYKGTLFECELIRDKNIQWSLSIGDIYYHLGKNMNKTIIIERMNIIHSILKNETIESEFTKTCPIQIKKYFDYKDIQNCIDNFIPHLSYQIRGFYFVPLKTTYSKILYLFPRDNNHSQYKKSNQSNQSNHLNQPNQSKKFNKPKNYLTFRIMKTLKPDVYELYLKDDDNLIKHSIALVQTIKRSHELVSYFENKNQFDEVFVKCKLNQNFNKWDPFELSNEPISSSKDL